MDEPEGEPSINVGEPAPKRRRLKSSRGGTLRGTGRGARSYPAPAAVHSDSACAPAPQADSNDSSTFDPSKLPIAAAEERYRAWKKAGGFHFTECFECRKPDDLVGCFTCRRSYHEPCKPEKGTTTGQGEEPRYFCDVCVVRGWHAKLPPLTPPGSPSPQPREGVEVGVEVGVQLGSNRASNRNQDAAQGTPRPAGTERRNDQTSTQSASKEAPAPRYPASSSFRPVDQPEESRRTGPGRSATARRSRYATLPTDVDSALRVLYCEVEAAAEFRQRVGDLEAQVTQLQRELSLQQSQLHLAQKAADIARASQSEIAKLRVEASDGKAAIDEAEMLRAENRDLKAELKDTREELNTATRTLQEWKQKLSTLISD